MLLDLNKNELHLVRHLLLKQRKNCKTRLLKVKRKTKKDEINTCLETILNIQIQIMAKEALKRKKT